MAVFATAHAAIHSQVVLAVERADPATIARTMEILRRRLVAAGIEGSRAERQGDTRISVDASEIAATPMLLTLLLTRAKLEFRRVLRPEDPLSDDEILPTGRQSRQESLARRTTADPHRR